MSKFLTLTGLSYFLDKIKGIFVGAASGTTEGNVVTFGADGKTITDSGYTLGTSVPADAKFTDTTYSAATTSKNGLMSKTDKAKLDDIAEGAEVNVIESVNLNGTALTVTDKTVNIDLSDYAKTSDISTVYRYKGSVASYSELPSNASVGDTYNIETADDANNIKAGDNVAWNGTAWDNLSGIFEVDISEITTAEIDTLFA